jgi:dolichol-phosphate mannosyltransferase
MAWLTDTALTMSEYVNLHVYVIILKKAGLTVELLIMDDESKGTPTTEKIVKELQSEGHNVRIHVRRKGEGRGLSSAVLLGFSMAK